MTIVIIGKKVPEGFEEEAGSIHLGDGVWIFKCKIKDAKSTKQALKQEDIRCGFCGHLSRVECQCEEGLEGYENFNKHLESEYLENTKNKAFNHVEGISYPNLNKSEPKKENS